MSGATIILLLTVIVSVVGLFSRKVIERAVLRLTRSRTARVTRRCSPAASSTRISPPGIQSHHILLVRVSARARDRANTLRGVCILWAADQQRRHHHQTPYRAELCLPGCLGSDPRGAVPPRSCISHTSGWSSCPSRYRSRRPCSPSPTWRSATTHRDDRKIVSTTTRTSSAPRPPGLRRCHRAQPLQQPPPLVLIGPRRQAAIRRLTPA